MFLSNGLANEQTSISWAGGERGEGGRGCHDTARKWEGDVSNQNQEGELTRGGGLKRGKDWEGDGRVRVVSSPYQLQFAGQSTSLHTSTSFASHLSVLLGYYSVRSIAEFPQWSWDTHTKRRGVGVGGANLN